MPPIAYHDARFRGRGQGERDNAWVGVELNNPDKQHDCGGGASSHATGTKIDGSTSWLLRDWQSIWRRCIKAYLVAQQPAPTTVKGPWPSTGVASTGNVCALHDRPLRVALFASAY